MLIYILTVLAMTSGGFADKCNPPKNYVDNLNYKEFMGTWFAYKQFGMGYDSSKLVCPKYDFYGTPDNVTNDISGIQKNKTPTKWTLRGSMNPPGFFKMEGTEPDVGQIKVKYWIVTFNPQKLMVAYLCSQDSDSIVYGYIMVRDANGKLSQKEDEEQTQKLKELGVDVSKLTGCAVPS